MTRAEATNLVGNSTSLDECARIFSEHKSNRVKRSAYARALHLGTLASRPAVEQGATSKMSAPLLAEQVVLAGKSEFDLLVEKFTTMGKKDPVKSARASLAAQAQAAKRKAANVAEA